MDDVSRRRRLLGRSLVVAGGLALPLTATVTYAASELPDAPEAPEAPAAPELPDVLPEAPLPPDEADGPHKEVRTIVIQRTDKHGKPMVQHFSFNGVPAIPPIPAIPAVPAIPSFQFHWNGSEDPDFQKKMEAWGKRMEKWGKDYGERYSKQAEAFAAQAERDAPEVIESCDGNPQTVTRHETTSDGRQRIVICQRVATRQALSGLRSARETIAGNEQMDPEVRDEVVQELDEEIQRIEGGDG